MADDDSMTGEELGHKLLAATREMAAGQGKVVHSPMIAARLATGLSQGQFAALLGECPCEPCRSGSKAGANPAARP